MTSASPDSPQSDGMTGTARSTSVDCVQTAAGVCRVGVLSPHNSKETKAILNAVRVLGHEPVWIRDENVSSWIENGGVQLSTQADVLVNRLLLTKSDQQLKDLQLAAPYADTTPVVTPPQAVANTLHKYRSGPKLAAAGLPVPDAYFGRSPRTFEEWPEHLPDEAAHKHTTGTNGQRMSVVSQNEPVAPTIADEQSFVQEFLEERGDRPYRPIRDTQTLFNHVRNETSRSGTARYSKRRRPARDDDNSGARSDARDRRGSDRIPSEWTRSVRTSPNVPGRSSQDNDYRRRATGSRYR
jgi:hypothetical protein